jgi:single-stranded DNA-binding protein
MTIIASIHGRAGADGELRQSAAGKNWSRLNVAVSAGADRESGEPFTAWITIVAFAAHAEELAKVAKGQPVSAMGRMEQTKWQAPDGETREGWQLIADAVVTARSSRPKGGRPAQAQGPAKPPGADIPFDDTIEF